MFRFSGLMLALALASAPAIAESPYGNFGSRGQGLWYGPPHLQSWQGDLYRHQNNPGWYRVCSYERGPASPYGGIMEAVENGVQGVETGEVKARCSTGYWYGRTGGWYYPGFGRPLDTAFGWPNIGDPGNLDDLPLMEFRPE